MGKNLKPHELRKRKTRVELNLEPSRAPRPILPERHLFVTEGTRTEPNYLRWLIDRICARYGEAARKQFQISPEGGNTLYLLSRAEKRLQSEIDSYQHVWIIYDKDDFPADNFDNTVARCMALNKRYRDEGVDVTFHALWSNECFELWLLLHFCYQNTDIQREQYWEMLSEYIGKPYDKTDSTVFDMLTPEMMEAAIKRSRTLMRTYGPNTPPSQRAPTTKFYELLECLKPYIFPAAPECAKDSNK